MNNLHLREGKIEFRWKRWRNKKRQEVSYCLMVLFSGAVLLGAGGLAAAGPTGGQVTSGTGTISQAGTTTTIDQTSNVLNINWQTFSTAPNETVNFVQPGSTSLAINRVVGGVPSYLQGALNANGRVFILNSAGITFTGTSAVNVGALLATTAMSITGDPTQIASYSAPSGGTGSVINQGSITVSNGGFAILAAPYVQNTGFIQANLGTIALAGTNSFTLDLRGDGLINFVVPPGTVQEIAQDGQKVGVDNSGTLQARSGQVLISANVATQVVNAVVNMTGVVDANAFAPNGAGGSVLVTSEGDINLGGTITAQGNGTGAGGQIVTKAGGIDNVEAGANLLAAGGSNGGAGGFIEVSGKTVKLDGNIDPGAGGSILIDPANMLVTPSGAGTGSTAAIVNEVWVAGQLQADHNVTLAATHDITFKGTNANANFTLLGGSGNLTVTAGHDILFSDVKTYYEIRTGNGNVAMSAGSDIGSNAHRLSIVSGYGTDNALYASVTQAGDIVLKATDGNIYLDNVTVTSTPGGSGDRHAKFSADAGGNINIVGAVDVEASATGDGIIASALVVLDAPNGKVTVNGEVTVLANADNGSGSHVIANANFQSDPSSLVLAGGLLVTAYAQGNGIWNADSAIADADITANHVTGNVNVAALATATDVGQYIGGIYTGKVNAYADADFVASTVKSNVTVTAIANGTDIGIYSGNNSGNYGANGAVTAQARVDLGGGATLAFTGDIAVAAKAHGSNVGVLASTIGGSPGRHVNYVDGLVSADGYVRVEDVAGAATIKGDVTVTANAHGSDVGSVIAEQNYAGVATSGHSVDGFVGAYAHVYASDIGGLLTFNSGVTVAAHATGSHVGVVTANGNYAHVATLDISTTGYTSTRSRVNGYVRARADISIDGYSGAVGGVTFKAPVSVTASANGQHVGSVMANGESAHVATLTANAHNGESIDGSAAVYGEVSASAYINLYSMPKDAVTFNGAVTVTANALGNDVGVVTADGTNARVGTMYASAHDSASVDGSVGVWGHVNASAGIDAINIGDLTFNAPVTVAAVANGNHVGSVTATGDGAHVATVFGNASSDGNVHGEYINGYSSARASVYGNVYADAAIYAYSIGTVAFKGALSVTANAQGEHVGVVVTGTGTNARVATANGLASNDGSADVYAAVDGGVAADASVNLNHVASSVTFNNVTVTANANGIDVGVVAANGNSAHVATANGSANAYSASYATASADAVVRGDVSAQASVNVNGNHYIGSTYVNAVSVTFKGPVAVTANAHGSDVGTVSATGNGARVAVAHADATYSADGLANAGVLGGVFGSASVDVSHFDTGKFNDAVTILAQAGGTHVGAVTAGNSAEVGVATADGAYNGYANALAGVGGFIGTSELAGLFSGLGGPIGTYEMASLDVHGIGSVTFNGAVAVTANAHGSDVGTVTINGNNARVAIGHAFATHDTHVAAADAVVLGFVHAGASIDVASNTSAAFQRNVAVTASANGIHVGAVTVDGNGAHVATADANAQGYTTYSGYTHYHDAHAFAAGLVAGGVNAQAGLGVYVDNFISFTGNLAVTANAHGLDVGTVVASGTNARIAFANAVEYIGTADGFGLVGGNVYAGASVGAEYLESLTFNGGVTVAANANGTHVGAVTATGNFAHVATTDGYGYRNAAVYGSVGADASIDASYMWPLTFNGGVAVTANAHGMDVGTVTASGNGARIADGYARVQGQVSADGSVYLHDMGSATFNGPVAVTAKATGTHVGAVATDATGDGAYIADFGLVNGGVSADAHVYVDSVDGYGVTFNGDLAVTANATGKQVGTVFANGSHAHVATFDGLVNGHVDASAYVEVSGYRSFDGVYFDQVTFNRDVTIAASANGSHVGTVTAVGNYANVADEHGRVVGGVYANAYMSGSELSALAFNGDLTVTANGHGIHVGSVTANGTYANVADYYGSVDGFVGAHASVDGSASILGFKGNATVTAHANGADVGVVSANGNSANVATADGWVRGYVAADASLYAISSGSLTFKGDVTVTAEANGTDVGTVTANGNYADVAIGFGHVNGYVGADASVSVDGDYMTALTFNGDLIVTASASGNRVGAVTANGQSADVGSFDGRINGAVSAQAFVNLYSMSSVTFNDEVTVTANANGKHVGSVAANGPSASVDGSIHGNVSAQASIDGYYVNFLTFNDTAHGNGVTVAAKANGSHVGVVSATGDGGYTDAYISGSVHASATLHAYVYDSVTFDNPVTVTASANGKFVGGENTWYSGNSFHGDVHANAGLFIDPSTLTFANGFDVEAKANGSYVGDVNADALAAFSVDGSVTVKGGPAKVFASANGLHASDVYANAHLVVASTWELGNPFRNSGTSFDVDGARSITFKQGIDVQAVAQGNDAFFVDASAGVALVASDIAVGGGILDRATAVGQSVDGVSANAILLVGEHFGRESGSESTSAAAAATIAGGIDVSAFASGDGAFNVNAFAGAELFADQLAVYGPTKVTAIASGNSVDGVVANAGLFADSNVNEYFQGSIGVTAAANVGTGGAYHANALATVDLDAGNYLTVFAPGAPGAGITVSALADPQHEARYAWAGAFIEADAGTYGSSGNLFIHGNVTAHAVALGTDTGNLALAFQHLDGSNVTVVGNIRSQAYADSIGDVALAGVSIDADLHGSESTPGGILIVGNDPIASAVAGTAHAFRQAHFSTEQTAHGLGASFAFADIDIESTGTVIVVPPTTDQTQKLTTLATDQPPPPWASSSLSEIPLSIAHVDCGVLGGAGNPEGKPDCQVPPFVIGGQDWLP